VLRGAITQSTVIESTTEISSLEGTSPRQTASTSAHRVPNTLTADYGRRRRKKFSIIGFWIQKCCDFRLLSRCKWDVHYSGQLHSACDYRRTEI